MKDSKPLYEMNTTWSNIVQKDVALGFQELNQERNRNLELIRDIMGDFADDKKIIINDRIGSNDILVNENGVEDRSQEKKYYRKRKVPRKKNKNYETKPKIGDDEKAQKISEQERYFQWEVYHSDIV